jgi:endogenous inhibitor of DNA gyrase (YacG/DUF329 family)
MSSPEPPGASRAKCPICDRASDQHYRPFCSRRCADVDLSRWLGGAYAIPDRAESEDGDEGRPAGDGDQVEVKRDPGRGGGQGRP